MLSYAKLCEAMLSVGKLVAAHGYRQKRENKLEIKKWEMREEGENSNELSLHLWFNLSFFNWSKLIFKHLFFLFYYFGFVALWPFFALFCSESITCQHAPRLSLVLATDDRIDFNGLWDLSTFSLSFGKHSWRMVFPWEHNSSTLSGAFLKDGVSLGAWSFHFEWSIPKTLLGE